MPTFAESVAGALKSGLCAVLGADDNANKLLERLVGFSTPPARLASGLRRQLCSDDPANDPSPDVPFTGGQCPVAYRLYSTTRDPTTGNINGGGEQLLGTRTGPISYIRLDPAPEGCVSPSTGEASLAFSSPSGAFNPISIHGAACGVFKQLVSARTERVDGLPDDCGDPAPEPVEPGPVEMPPTNITYNIDESTEITVPLTAIFAPVFVSVDGSIKIPVTVNVDGLDFDGTVTISPDFNVSIKPTINIGGPGSPDDPDGIGQPGGGSEPIDGVEDLESTIIGVLVYSDIVSEKGSTGVDFTNGPDLYVPRLASVQFAVKTQDSIGWTSDQDVKNVECYVPCPAPQGAIAVRVSSMPGVQSRFTAVRGVPLTEF